MYKNYEDKLNTILSNAKGEKVELGLMDDITKIYEEAQRFSAIAEGKGLSDVRKTILRVENDFIKLMRKSEDGIDLIEKAEKQLKELGVTKPREIQGIENVLNSYIASSDRHIKNLRADQYR